MLTGIWSLGASRNVPIDGFEDHEINIKGLDDYVVEDEDEVCTDEDPFADDDCEEDPFIDCDDI